MIIKIIISISLFAVIFLRAENATGIIAWWCAPLVTVAIIATSAYIIIANKKFKKEKKDVITFLMAVTALCGTAAGVYADIGNTSEYAMCVSLSAPALLFFINNKSRWIKTATILLFIINFIFVAHSLSRTGIIAMSISLFWGISAFVKDKRKTRFIAILFILITFAVGLFVKEDSSKGRIFILERSLEMIKEQPWGRGYYGFEADYMNFQANFFKSNPNHNKATLADDIKHPLNEFVYVAVNYGIFSLIAILCLFIYCIYKLHKIQGRNNLCLLHFLTLLFVWCCFSYPFSISFVKLFIFVYIINCDITTLSIWDKRTYKIFFALLLSFLLLINIKIAHDKFIWNKAVKDYQKGYIEEAMDVFKNHNNFWINKGIISYSLATIEYNSKNYNRCIHYCNLCKDFRASYEMELMLGNSNFFINEHKKAEEHFLKAHYMCPNRFIPLYKLFIIYKNKGDFDKMIKTGNEILCKEIKVPSHKVDIIINNVKFEMQNNL